MKNRSFLWPMKRPELIFGWIYLPIHFLGLPILLSIAALTLLPRMGITLDDPHMNFLYYCVSFIIILVFMFRYLKSSFSDFIDNVARALASVGLGFLMYYIANLAVNVLILYFTDNLTNPNTEVINASAKLNVNMMTAVGVFLAPVVEETLFRGVVFGSLRRKNRALAYILSALLFAVYHLWDSFIGGFDYLLFLYLLQYIPAGFILAWCYEHGRSVWTPIFLHMIINYVSISIQLG